MKNLKIVVEHHEDGYIAYPVGLNGIVIGEGNTFEEALEDVRSAIRFHIETFGKEAMAELPEEVTLAEVSIA